MTRRVTPDAVPITAVTNIEGELWIYEGHIKKEVLSPKVRAEHNLEPDAVLVVWHTTFDVNNTVKAALALAKTGHELRQVVFR